MKGNITVRIHVNEKRSEQLPQIKDRVKGALPDDCEVTSVKEEPYWKIPEHIVLTIFATCSPDRSTAIATKIAHQFSPEWETVGDDDDRSLIWNPEPASSEGIEWACVQSFLE